MSCTLTSGRTEPCKNEIGGIKAVYFMPYVKYDYSQIVGVRGSTLTSFPTTDVYKYVVQGGSFTERIESKEDGFLVEQSLDFTLWKMGYFTNQELSILEKIDFRYIIEMNNGKFRIGGLFDGGRIDSINAQTGGALGDLNGYQVSISSQERWAAPFISDLSDVGFNEVNNYLFEDADFVLFMNGEEYIFN